MENDYVVLRSSEAPRKEKFSWDDAFRTRGPGTFAARDVPLDLKELRSSWEGVRGSTVEVEHHSSLTEAEAADVSRDPRTLAAAPAMPVTLIKPLQVSAGGAASLSDAKQSGASWGIAAVGADTSDATGEGVVVAVLDTGIDPKHPAFAGIDLSNRENFTDSSDPDDEQGHGTHCAGTIFGRDVNGVRIGVARGVPRPLIGKVLDKNGRGSSLALAKAIRWAVDEGANVVSMSIGFDVPGLITELQQRGFPSTLAASKGLRVFRDNVRLFDTLMANMQALGAFGAGCVFVAASGNESARAQNPDFVIDVSLPAASNGIISVGALRRGEKGLDIASFSNINPALSAPGVDIVSAQRGGELIPDSGTSMACPHVAAVAALWWQRLRGDFASPQTVAAKLVATARTDVFAGKLGPVDRGAGLVFAPQPVK